MLRPDVQVEIAERTVQIPATVSADLPEDCAELALERPEPVTVTYDEFRKNVEAGSRTGSGSSPGTDLLPAPGIAPHRP